MGIPAIVQFSIAQASNVCGAAPFLLARGRIKLNGYLLEAGDGAKVNGPETLNFSMFGPRNGSS